MAPRSWVDWRSLLGFNHPRTHDSWWEESRQRLLPHYVDDSLQSAIPPADVTKIALRLRYLIEEAVPIELSEDQITQPHSKVISSRVIAAAKDAARCDEHVACVPFCLLVCKRWFQHQSIAELWDSELHSLRATTCEVIAKALIEGEDDSQRLTHHMLLKRYSIILDGEPTPPCNVIEKAVDLHALRVIGSAGYQKCVSYLWRGWLVQDEDDPSSFVEYDGRDDTRFFSHLDPDRMRAPMYQNAVQLLISLIYLGLYTGAINSINRDADLDFVEGLLYVFTFGFVCDEVAKGWKAGYQIYGFWTAFNFILYGLLTTSLVLRFVALSNDPTPDGVIGDRDRFNIISYNFLACCAPMFWMRLLLYLDSFRFFGAMLVVLKVMMKESLIFFALLLVIIIGFLQAFIGLDLAEDNVVSDSWFIIQQMANSIMQSPDFSNFEKFGHPFGLILYYVFTFVVMVVLLNILIALYNSSYESISDNANDEYLAVFAQKTLQFVRAPDENVFIAPFNLIEIFFLALPLEWWMPKKQYERLNDVVMGIIYSPLLLVAAVFEVQIARDIRANRARGEDDDDTLEEWDQMADQMDFDTDGWKKTVSAAKTDLQADPTVNEVKKLRAEVEKLTGLVLQLGKALGQGGEDDDGEGDDSKKAQLGGFSRTSTAVGESQQSGLEEGSSQE
ncbi:hypothetical protein BD289DRAFT_483565 [Coniella lustricola]|uniref:Uncharacterized protein n=1 Tax=Coniella lustricola TaxID=2025994 RepID=A0A2T3A524_9PEZI|nr:hypothetical protein BD289DRAFT_483565 [Coniella lustricola]